MTIHSTPEDAIHNARTTLLSWGETGAVESKEDLIARLKEWMGDLGCQNDNLTWHTANALHSDLVQ